MLRVDAAPVLRTTEARPDSHGPPEFAAATSSVGAMVTSTDILEQVDDGGGQQFRCLSQVRWPNSGVLEPFIHRSVAAVRRSCRWQVCRVQPVAQPDKRGAGAEQTGANPQASDEKPGPVGSRVSPVASSLIGRRRARRSAFSSQNKPGLSARLLSRACAVAAGLPLLPAVSFSARSDSRSRPRCSGALQRGIGPVCRTRFTCRRSPASLAAQPGLNLTVPRSSVKPQASFLEISGFHHPTWLRQSKRAPPTPRTPNRLSQTELRSFTVRAAILLAGRDHRAEQFPEHGPSPGGPPGRRTPPGPPPFRSSVSSRTSPFFRIRSGRLGGPKRRHRTR